MTSVGADKTFAHSGARLEFDPKSLPFGEGDRIAEKYEVIRVLGSGGMAFVVAARHIEFDAIVALKFLRPEFLADVDLVGRFVREGRASVKIENEHVARIFDVGAMPDGAPFLVMEYLEGKDLGALVREEGPAPVACASEYLLQGCEALAAAHAIGIVHRDVKPESLLLARRTQGLDVIKLLDVGISKVALTGSAVDGSGPRVKSMALMGTPLYMSPEQIRASNDLDGRTDIWSLGCVLYELLTGHAPFEAPSITLMTASILERPAPPLRERRPDVPEELETVVARCLAKDPAHRFPSVSQLAAALYPFAPCRARLSVERCSQILRHAGLTPAPLAVRSIPPPRSMAPPRSIPSPSNASPHPATTPPTAASQVGESTTRPSDEPASVEVPLPTSATARRWKAPLWAGLCLLIVAGAYAARRPHLDTILAGATSVIEGAPPPAVSATAPATADMTSPARAPASITGTPTPSEVDALGAKTPPTGSATPKPRSRKSHKGNSQAGTSEEIDVGF